MALPAVVLLALGAGGGALIASAYARAQQKQLQEDAGRQKALQMATSELQQGRNYGVQIWVDPKDPTWGGVRDVAQASANIKAAMQQHGWGFGIATPQPRDAAAAALFRAGNIAEWNFPATWNRPEKFVTSKPSWLVQLMAYPVPG